MMWTFSLEIIEALPRLMERLTIQHGEVGDGIPHLHGFTDRVELSQECMMKLSPSGYRI